LIPAKRAHLKVAAITDPGRKGKNNEDRYAVVAHRLGRARGTSSVFAVIADGVGGHRAGEVAAELAVEAISRIVSGSDAKTPLETLQVAFQQANQIINSQAESELTQKGMSTTGACAWVIGNRLYIASVGDSRIYLLRGDRIRQITIDHTWVQEAISSGVLSLEQARDHPNSHVIRRHLGSSQPVAPDFRLRLRDDEDDLRAEANQGLPLGPGDQILICSDGLTDLVEDGEIRESPMARMQVPKIPEQPPAVLGEETLRKIVRACDGQAFEDRRDMAIIRLMIDTGCRIGEVLGLRWCPGEEEGHDVDLDRGLVQVQGKGRRWRVVSLGPRTARALDRYLRLRSAHRDAASTALWLGRRGPLTDQGLRLAIRRRGLPATGIS